MPNLVQNWKNTHTQGIVKLSAYLSLQHERTEQVSLTLGQWATQLTWETVDIKYRKSYICIKYIYMYILYKIIVVQTMQD